LLHHFELLDAVSGVLLVRAVRVASPLLLLLLEEVLVEVVNAVLDLVFLQDKAEPLIIRNSKFIRNSLNSALTKISS
jgi:hypothetical protein